MIWNESVVRMLDEPPSGLRLCPRASNSGEKRNEPNSNCPKRKRRASESGRDARRQDAAIAPEVAYRQIAIVRSALAELAERFDEVAVPKHGRYVL